MSKSNSKASSPQRVIFISGALMLAAGVGVWALWSPESPAPKQAASKARTASCGDGVISGKEQCDGDALPEGAKAGQACSSTCTLVLAATRCGDGIIQGNEQCDGESLPVSAPTGSTCNFLCKLVEARAAGCGDRVVQGSEECDGPAIPDDAPEGSTCSPRCKLIVPDPSESTCASCVANNCAEQRAEVDGALSSVSPILDCVLREDWQDNPRIAAGSCANQDLLTCYCGTMPGQHCATTEPAALNGKCVAEVLAGTSCEDSMCVAGAYMNATSPNGKAMRYAQCVQDSCFSECRPSARRAARD